MSIDTVKIDQVLEELAVDEKSRFNAYFISYYSNQSNVDEVNDLLMKARFGALIVKVESICPENHIDQQFDIDKFPEVEIECRFCDEDSASYMPDIENTNIVFYFTHSYIESVKKKTVKSALLAI